MAIADAVDFDADPELPAALLLPSDFEATLRAVIDQQPIFAFHGLDGLGMRAACLALARAAGRSFLSIDLAQRSDAVAQRILFEYGLRDARMLGAVPFVSGWDQVAKQPLPLIDMLNTVCQYPGPIVVASQMPWHLSDVERDRPVAWQSFPAPEYRSRVKIWQHFLATSNAPVPLDLSHLAGQFQLTAGQIRDAIASACDYAVVEGREVNERDLFAAARSHSSPNLAGLARKIIARYGWDDLVLPADQRALLAEMISTVRSRPRVLDEWGLGHKLVSSRGITALFSGPPGTGKTMAAEIISTELGLDLYKIDLSTVVSKYIGETEKNLEKIFTEAQSSNSILFFDEADSLFGKRSEVKDSHDRYANLEISYLLQRMESYDGITVLATNLRANLDEAFTRRLQFVIDFPFPESPDRLAIWQTLFPSQLPQAANLAFEELAARFELSGGSIRNVIVGAAYLAAADGGQVTMKHLLHGTRRELQKMGRLVQDLDLLEAAKS